MQQNAARNRRERGLLGQQNQVSELKSETAIHLAGCGQRPNGLVASA
jgi:hypothetical protein